MREVRGNVGGSWEVPAVVQPRADGSLNWFVVVDTERSFGKYLGAMTGGLVIDRMRRK